MGLNLQLNPKWFGIGLKLAALIPGTVAMAQNVFKGKGRGEEKAAAVIEAARTILEASEDIADRNFVNDDDVLAAVKGVADAVVALNNIIVEKKSSKYTEVK